MVTLDDRVVPNIHFAVLVEKWIRSLFLICILSLLIIAFAALPVVPPRRSVYDIGLEMPDESPFANVLFMVLVFGPFAFLAASAGLAFAFLVKRVSLVCPRSLSRLTFSSLAIPVVLIVDTVLLLATVGPSLDALANAAPWLVTTGFSVALPLLFRGVRRTIGVSLAASLVCLMSWIDFIRADGPPSSWAFCLVPIASLLLALVSVRALWVSRQLEATPQWVPEFVWRPGKALRPSRRSLVAYLAALAAAGALCAAVELLYMLSLAVISRWRQEGRFLRRLELWFAEVVPRIGAVRGYLMLGILVTALVIAWLTAEILQRRALRRE